MAAYGKINYTERESLGPYN